MAKLRSKPFAEIKQEVLDAIGMDREQTEARVREILLKERIGISFFRHLVVEDEKVLIITNKGTVECDMQMRFSKKREPDVNFTVGNNPTGHRLPASSCGSH